jgi:hypothetical protein
MARKKFCSALRTTAFATLVGLTGCAMDFPLARSGTGLPCSAEMTRSVRTE